MVLFMNTQKLTSAKEDHLTEFFAASLRASQAMRDKFMQVVFGADDERAITLVETQSLYPNCRPDMRIELDDGFVLLCENKLDAMETIGNEKTDFTPQLTRYLTLPVDGVMYIRTSLKAPATNVLAHPRYIHPVDKQHFLWQDFYSTLLDDDNALVCELKAGFEYLGFVPPNPIIGDLTRNAPREQRVNFGKFWLSTTSVAAELGWKVYVGDIVERYFYHAEARLADWVYINPINPERFLVRLSALPGNEGELLGLVQQSTEHTNQSITKRSVKRSKGVVTVVDVEAPISSVLPNDLTTAHDIEATLHNYVLPFLDIAFGHDE
ncbi:TPA: hypothetical protein N2812_000390 [Vibrio parahaemolyticus]|nr:hypothetical protein [Vibrio parahaemolyticus]